LNILLASLSIVFLVVVLTLNPIASYSAATVSLPMLIALLVCLIPTTIGALLSAIGIAGMDRLVQRNVLAMSGRAVEAAGDVTILLLDKTGTVTYGNRQAREFAALTGVTEAELVRAAALSSLSDPTPEGKSIVDLAAERGFSRPDSWAGDIVPFTAQTRMSGIDFTGGRIRKGAGSAVLAWVGETGPVADTVLAELTAQVERVSRLGGTPLVVGMGSVVAPESLAGAVRYAHEVAGVPVFVTEHGMQTEDDTLRAEFIPQALAHLAEEVAAGTPVLGYAHWTLMDNFEWIFGYGPKLGLFAVHRDTFTRTAKPSAAAYAAAVAELRPVGV
jgi:K+-transporting ATPase ATPase B chain